jgi:hypothetical protein
MFKKEKKEAYTDTGELVKVEIPNKDDILKEVWNDLLEYAFTMIGPNDGQPLSVIRVADIYTVLSKKTDKKLPEY